jgi:hypothetical protein
MVQMLHRNVAALALNSRVRHAMANMSIDGMAIAKAWGCCTSQRQEKHI